MRGKLVFGARTLVMGVINLTPDSFYAGSRVEGVARAVERARELADAGADIIDVGGVSTRPGAGEVPLGEEMDRVVPAVEGIRGEISLPVSVDTSRPEVAAAAIERGAVIVNDVTGLGLGNGLEDVVRSAGAHIVLMHMRGTPRTMQQLASYSDVVGEVSRELDRAIALALGAGIDREMIIVDPGIGFAKKVEHNLALLTHLPAFKAKGYPLLVGLSRKSFLGAITGLAADERLVPTIAADAIAIFQGADIIRVHDVREAVITAKVADALKKA